MTDSRLARIAQDLARRADRRVLDYEAPPPRTTARDLAWALLVWCEESTNLLAFCLGVLAMIAGGSMAGSPRTAGLLLAAAAALWMFATVRWAYGRSGRW